MNPRFLLVAGFGLCVVALTALATLGLARIDALDQAAPAGFPVAVAVALAVLTTGAAITRRALAAIAQTQARLERGKELAEVTLHSIMDGVITTDAAGLVDYMNPVAERYLGWRRAAGHSRRFTD